MIITRTVEFASFFLEAYHPIAKSTWVRDVFRLNVNLNTFFVFVFSQSTAMSTIFFRLSAIFTGFRDF